LHSVELRPPVDTLAALPNVVAVALCGRARRLANSPTLIGISAPTIEGLSTPTVCALDLDGTVVDAGEWGRLVSRLVNGGAWLVVDGSEPTSSTETSTRLAVDEPSPGGALRGDRAAGLPTYVVAGGLAVCNIPYGDLLPPAFPDVLRRSASREALGDSHERPKSASAT
jgi:hypothetical protein